MSGIDKATISFFIRLQRQLAKAMHMSGWNGSLRYLLGLDVSYARGVGVAAAVLYDYEEKTTIKSNVYKGKVFFPYIPGLLYLREAPLMLAAAEPLKDEFDLALVDGHGYAHPRRAGLAVIVGVLLDRPVVGIAKSLLEGRVEEVEGEVSAIVADGEVIGWASAGPQRYYASIGHAVSNEDVRRIVLELGGSYPAPLREAHDLATRMANEAKG